MKLRGKIQLAFCTLVVVPIMLIAVILGVGTYKLKTMYNTYKIDMNAYTILLNPMLAFNAVNSSIEAEVNEIVSSDVAKLTDVDFLEQYSSELANDATYIMVRVEDKYLYFNLSDENKKNELFRELDKFDGDGYIDDRIIGGVYLGGNIQMLVNTVSFKTNKGENAVFYILTYIEHLVPKIRGMAVRMLIFLAITLVTASACMTAWIYKGMVSPIRKLKEATHNIAEGNLDFTIENNRKDEIGELIDDFETMRKRLKQNTEEKMQYDKESKELVSNISHDLKTPMTAIKGYVEGIIDGVADTPEKMDKYIKTIYNKTMDMDRLINELTLYSKIDTNKIPYNFNKIKVSDYFEDCVDEIKMDLEAKNIELGYFNYTAPDTLIVADAEQLKRVINNIISNSVKYISNTRKGIINIRITDEEDFVKFEIEDNGKGIAHKDLQYIFDRFYRTDASRNSSQGGSGIGLSIVKKIISDHGGQIWATSKEGTGTVMHFVLRKYKM